MDSLDEYGVIVDAVAAQGERTLKEVRERYHAKPQLTAKTLGLKIETCERTASMSYDDKFFQE